MVMLEGGRGVGESHGQNVYTSFPRSYLILILILIPMPNLDGAHVRRVEKKRKMLAMFVSKPSHLGSTSQHTINKLAKEVSPLLLLL